MTEYLREEIRKAIRSSGRKPLVICGAGVSIQATNGSAPSWASLIASGIRRVADLDATAAAWAEENRQKLTGRDTSVWIAVADEITRKLGGANNAEFATWLHEEVGELTAARYDLLDAILGLDCPIATTNYDDILENAANLQPIGWDDHAGTLQMLEGKRLGILHLHGHWRSPRSVVLGALSYDKHANDERRKFLQSFAAIDRPTIFIGCSQDGLADPDFSRLDSFLAEWEDVAPRRYWFVREEMGKGGHAAPAPDHKRRLFPVSFGPRFEDLIFILRSLSVAAARSTTIDADVSCIDQHEPKPEIFGREVELETVVNCLLSGKLAIVAGGPGMGKTAVAIAALYDQRVVQYFGRRRVFASLETSTEPRSILAKIVEMIGVPATGDEATLQRILETYAADQPIAAILDNAETVLDLSGTEAERLLSLIAPIKGLSLVVTNRGISLPIPGAVRIDDLPKLPTLAARQAFLSIAGIAFDADPDISYLLDGLDGHALSIRLVAAQAIGLSALKGLREAWDEVHAKILRSRGPEEGRLTSVRASLALSLNNRKMTDTPLARRLLALLAFMPGGLSESDVHLLLADRGTLTKTKANEATACLHQLRLVERRLDRRLRMLTPLRECVKDELSLFPSDKVRLINRYLGLAAKGDKIGWGYWSETAKEVEPEIENFDSICMLAIRTNIDHKRLGDALFGLCQINRLSGKGSLECLELVSTKYRTKVSLSLFGQCISELGEVSMLRGDEQQAMARFKEALSAFRASKNIAGQAHTIFCLGELAAYSEYQLAIKYFTEALELFRTRKEPRGEANCIDALGGICLNVSDQAGAQRRYEEALVLYRQIGDLVGQALSLRGLGELECEKGHYNVGSTIFQKAYELDLRSGSVPGQASCIENLARAKLHDLDFDGAYKHFDEARHMWRRLGRFLGESNCMSGLGTIALFQSNYGGAKSYFDEALGLAKKRNVGRTINRLLIRTGMVLLLMGKLENGISMIERGFSDYFRRSENDEDLARAGFVALRKAILSDNLGRREAEKNEARSVWTSLGRLDFVVEWLHDSMWRALPLTPPTPPSP